MKLSGVVGTYSWCPSSSSLTRGLLKVQCAAVREDSHCARRKHLEIAPSRSPWFVSAGLEMMLGWRDGETRRFTSSFSLYSRPISNFPSSSAFLSITHHHRLATPLSEPQSLYQHAIYFVRGARERGQPAACRPVVAHSNFGGHGWTSISNLARMNSEKNFQLEGVSVAKKDRQQKSNAKRAIKQA